MLKLVLAVGLGIPAALLSVVAATGVLLVDVKADGARIVVPVPLLAAQVVASVLPDTRIPFDKAGRFPAYLPVAQEALAELAKAPDCELVRVEDGEEQVLITKAGDMLRVRVHGRNEDVTVNVPISAALDLLHEAEDGVVTAADVVGVLRSVRLTNVVEVRDGDERVSVRVF